MNFEELSYIVDKLPKLKNSEKISISIKGLTDGGSEHPLWTLINTKFPPPISWKRLSGLERKQILRAAEKLHKHNIPYSFYTNFLERFRKGYFKHLSPLILTKYLIEKGKIPILSEYISMMEFLIKCYKENPIGIKIHDKVCSNIKKDLYVLGVLKYTYSIKIIYDALKNHTPAEIISTFQDSKDLFEFWDKIGESVQNNKFVNIDISKGTDKSSSVKTLQKEMRIRMGKADGKPNPFLNKFFKKNGQLNLKGIKIISGE